jgi:hypothetical protein
MELRQRWLDVCVKLNEALEVLEKIAEPYAIGEPGTWITVDTNYSKMASDCLERIKA